MMQQQLVEVSDTTACYCPFFQQYGFVHMQQNGSMYAADKVFSSSFHSRLPPLLQLTCTSCSSLHNTQLQLPASHY